MTVKVSRVKRPLPPPYIALTLPSLFQNFDLTDMQNVIHHKSSGGNAEFAQHVQVSERTQRRESRLLSVAALPPPPPPTATAAMYNPPPRDKKRTSSDEFVASLDPSTLNLVTLTSESQNAVKFKIHDKPEKRHGEKKESLFNHVMWEILHYFETTSHFELALFYRTFLFVIPVANNFFMILSLTNTEYYSYVSYTMAPFIVVCVAMHAMARPKKQKELTEEWAILALGILTPLFLNTISLIKYQVFSERSGVPTYLRIFKMTASVVAFLGTLFGGVFMAKSARRALAFRPVEEIKEHLTIKVRQRCGTETLNKR